MDNLCSFVRFGKRFLITPKFGEPGYLGPLSKKDTEEKKERQGRKEQKERKVRKEKKEKKGRKRKRHGLTLADLGEGETKAEGKPSCSKPATPTGFGLIPQRKRSPTAAASPAAGPGTAVQSAQATAWRPAVQQHGAYHQQSPHERRGGDGAPPPQMQHTQHSSWASHQSPREHQRPHDPQQQYQHVQQQYQHQNRYHHHHQQQQQRQEHQQRQQHQHHQQHQQQFRQHQQQFQQQARYHQRR
eukprot:g6534.t1